MLPADVMIDLTSLEFDFRSVGGTDTRELSIGTELTNSIIFDERGPGRPDVKSVSIPLADPAYAGLSDVTVGVYLFAQDNTGSGDNAIDNIYVKGEYIDIPESRAAGLFLGIASLALVARRCCCRYAE